MHLLRFLLRASWTASLCAVGASLLSGACNAGLLALINRALHRVETATTALLWGFAALALTRLLTSTWSRILLTRAVQRTSADLRWDLSRRILATPLPQLEELGIPRLFVALTDDVQVIMNALRNIPSLAVNSAILIGCSIYLGWLSWTTFLAIGALIGLGLGSYWGLLAHRLPVIRLARREQDTLFRHFRTLTEGMKELKTHRQRRLAFLCQALEPTIERLRHYNVASMTRLILVRGWNQFLVYVLIGLLLFALPVWKEIGTQTLTGYILTIVYLLGPLEAVMQVLPSLSRANVALQHVEGLGLAPAMRPSAEQLARPPEPSLTWDRLDLIGIVYTYERDGFTLGPIDLTLYPGALVFVGGGNGSGKSTLTKILAGLYVPQAGEICLQGQTITDANREWYCQHFSVVFSDFHLFESLLGAAIPSLDIQVQRYLEQLQLHHKVQVQDGAFSTTALSQGQRRRLALLTAYLEDRPIYIFDEWAADQDRHFKEIFYTQLLPELKRRGKAVLVISHDERYFSLADRVIKLEDGQLVAAANSGGRGA